VIYTLADIAQGNSGAADVCFLIAAILFGIAAITHLFGPGPAPAGSGSRVGWPWTSLLVDVGLCLLAVGFLLL
jgi:hypothetical protein